MGNVRPGKYGELTVTEGMGQSVALSVGGKNWYFNANGYPLEGPVTGGTPEEAAAPGPATPAAAGAAGTEDESRDGYDWERNRRNR